MLQIQTYLAPSSIHGIGLFASTPIRKGTVIWRLNPEIDRIYTPRKFFRICQSAANEIELLNLISSTYKRNNRYYYVSDNSRFINHSPIGYNMEFAGDGCEVAVVDIPAYQELLENYYLSYDYDDLYFLEQQRLDLTRFVKLSLPDRKKHANYQNLLRQIRN